MAFLPGECGTDDETFPQIPDYYLAETALSGFSGKVVIAMNELIRLEGITKKFGEHLIIPTLDLTINDGEFVTLLGPSGCGKTTLLRMIAGLETPTTGKVILDGKDITKLPPYKRNVNMVFQNYALFPHMTVTENIHFGLKMQGVPNDEAQERINQVLYLTQLEQFRDRYPSQMSGGQQQRVAIARALVNSPKVLLLDEPPGCPGLPAAEKTPAGTEKLTAWPGPYLCLRNP